MSTSYDDRDDERDWPEDDSSHAAGKKASEAAEPPEPEDDAAHLPVRHATARRPQPRRRGSYRPPSELDHE